MAELGLIASTIQVAGAGFKLSQTLYQYADSVATAYHRVKDIAKEVRLTAVVIDELATLFRQNEASTLLSQNALAAANETVRECSTLFTELDAAIKKSKKNTLGRLTLPFREPKIQLLGSHIDKLKSTLQLLKQVLTHAHQVDAHSLDRKAEAAQRKEIRALFQAKIESAKKYEESLNDYAASEESTVLDDDKVANEQQEPSLEKSTLTKTSSISSSVTVKSLEACVQHIQGLLQHIETLQKALSNPDDGIGHSEHRQSLVGSYFRARSHFDSILLENPSDVNSESTIGEEFEKERVSSSQTSSSISITKALKAPNMHVEIPVDVLTASRIVDEKRTKDLASSARFRAGLEQKHRDFAEGPVRPQDQIQHAFAEKHPLTSGGGRVEDRPTTYEPDPDACSFDPAANKQDDEPVTIEDITLSSFKNSSRIEKDVVVDGVIGVEGRLVVSLSPGYESPHGAPNQPLSVPPSLHEWRADEPDEFPPPSSNFDRSGSNRLQNHQASFSDLKTPTVLAKNEERQQPIERAAHKVQEQALGQESCLRAPRTKEPSSTLVESLPAQQLSADATETMPRSPSQSELQTEAEHRAQVAEGMTKKAADPIREYIDRISRDINNPMGRRPPPPTTQGEEARRNKAKSIAALDRAKARDTGKAEEERQAGLSKQRQAQCAEAYDLPFTWTTNITGEIRQDSAAEAEVQNKEDGLEQEVSELLRKWTTFYE